MMAVVPEEIAVLELDRWLNAAPAQVFDALTRPEAIERWFSPDTSMRVEVLAHDLRVGGEYRIRMIEPDGESYTVHGVFETIDPPAQLRYSWAWEVKPGEQALDYSRSTVGFELREERGGCRLRLRHERLPTEQMRLEHEQGWLGALQRLEAMWA